MRKFSLPVVILVGFSLSTAGWLSFDAGRRIQLSKVEKPMELIAAKEVEDAPTKPSAVTSEPEVATNESERDFGFDFEQLDQKASRVSFTKDGFTYKPIKGNPEETFWFLNGGLKLTKDRRQLLTLRQKSFVGRWLTFPLSSSSASKSQSHSRFRRYPDEIRGESATRMDTPFVDITGDGTKDVVVASYTGGAHCCYEYDVYSLKRRARKYDHIDGAHSLVEFVDLNGDGEFEALAHDWTFAYWQACFAASPAPLVILSPTRRGYGLNVPLMKLPPPSKSELEALVEECGVEFNEIDKNTNTNLTPVCVSSDVWSTMLDLIYTGNSKFAWKFLDLYWANGPIGEAADSVCDLSKTEFRKKFLDQLSCSPYWKELKALNRNDPVLRSHK